MNDRPEMNLDRMVWLDFETTGVRDARDEHILEVATIVTDNELQVLGEHHTVVYQPPEVLEGMQDGARALHEASGLLSEIEPKGVALHSAETAIILLLEEHDAEMSPLCGNTIHYDRAFVNYHMPNLAWPNYLHYHNVDVRQLYQMHKRWLLDAIPLRKFKKTHRAMDDILDSIEMYRTYKTAFQGAFSTAAAIRKDGYNASSQDAAAHVSDLMPFVQAQVLTEAQDGVDHDGRYTNEQVVTFIRKIAATLQAGSHQGDLETLSSEGRVRFAQLADALVKDSP